MKTLTYLVAFCLTTSFAYAQTPATDAAPLDSLAHLSQRYLNKQQPDSLYALMGTAFRQQVSAEQLRTVMGQLQGQLGNWTGLERRSITNGLARYKATFALATLDFYISRDKQGRIETFAFKPLQEN